MSVHRTVQSTRLKSITVEEQRCAFDAALSVLATRFPQQVRGDHMHSAWLDCEVYLPHVLAFDSAVRRQKPVLDNPVRYINMMCDCTWYVTHHSEP